MHPALLTPSGIPRVGLVAWHDLWFPNIAVQSAAWDTSPWAATNVTVADDAGDPPVAGMAVHTLTATADAGTVLQTSTMLAGSSTNIGIWLKRKTGSGNVSIQTKAGTSTVVAVSAEWQCLSPSALAIGASNEANAWGIILATNTDAVYVGGAQCYPGTLPTYAATTTLQQAQSGLIDLSGRGNHLSRGSNASAADTNDPPVLGPGLYFSTDDRANTGVISGCPLSGRVTYVLAFKPTYVAVGDLAALVGGAGNVLRFAQVASGRLTCYAEGGGSNNTSGQLTVTNDAPVVCALVGNAGATLYRLDTMASVATTPITATGDSTLYLGVSSSYTRDATIYESLLYNRVLSLAELQRIRRTIKAKWAARPGGVTIL